MSNNYRNENYLIVKSILFFQVLLFLFFLRQFANCQDVKNDDPLSNTFYSKDDIVTQSNNTIQRQSYCGPIALSRCLTITGNKIPVQTVINQFKTKTERGVKFSELLECTRCYYPNANAVVIPVNDLAILFSPAIIIIKKQEHCLVYEYFDAATSTFQFWDPAVFAVVEYSLQELSEIWDGEIILLNYTASTSSNIKFVMLLCSFFCMVFTVFLAAKSCKKSKEQVC
ncbi:MAG: hypothetical protein LBC74_15865 [Planctomycetaceae bacterium]|jgi:hypothetical protein|nr:hypothetical protein [Planctomycetaceae bacterium]